MQVVPPLVWEWHPCPCTYVVPLTHPVPEIEDGLQSGLMPLVKSDALSTGDPLLLPSPPKPSLAFQDCKQSHGWRDDFLILVEALRICLCERRNILLEGYLSVCPILNHIAFDFSSMMIPRQPPLAILTCLNLWVVGKQFFWCYSSPSQRPRSLVEQCLNLIDVIWTPGRGHREVLGEKS